MPRHRSRIKPPLPPLLTRLVHAVTALEASDGSARREYGQVAPTEIPTHRVVHSSSVIQSDRKGR